MAENAKILASNKTAARNYFFLEKFEAGIELFGTEVKSIRRGRVNLKDCYAAVDSGELFVYGMHISPYEHGSFYNHEPLRERRLLLHRREINKLIGVTSQQGCTIIPLRLYFKGQRVKLAVGICRGKKNYDKRATAAERDAKRNIDRALKANYR